MARWVRWTSLAVVFAVACGFLSNWQLNRRIQIVKVIERVERNYDHQRVRLDLMVPQLRDFKMSREYRRVWLAGSYLPKKTVLIRNRPLDGIQGFQVVTPFRLESGEIILMDRGWVPTGDSPAVPAFLPLPSSQPQLVVGRLKATEPKDSRTAPNRQTLSINSQAIAKQVNLAGQPIYSGAYLLLEQESIVSRTGKLSSKPSLNEGNHLSYAFQWVIFAVMAFIAVGWAVRKEQVSTRMQADPTFVVKKRRRVGDEDNAAEDALLDG